MMRGAHHHDMRGAQHGQALVLGMVLLGIALVAFTRYFHTGQVVAARARQTHALDAAAYSGALVQARALNMLSYLNRAQVGHHVAMAHLVTLGSWASLAGIEAQQLSRGNPPAHLIGMLFGPQHGAAYLAAARAAGFDAMARQQGDLASAYSAHDRVVRHMFTGVQDQIARSVPDARRKTMIAVLDQNYTEGNLDRNPQVDADFQLSVHDDEWPGFIERRAASSLRVFVQDASSLYRFLAPRNHTAKNSWTVDARCPTRRHELRRRGTTAMDEAGRWQSIDTQSFHALRSNRWIGCYFREYAMGWGWIPSAASQTVVDPHVTNPPENFSSQDFWRWVRESTDWDIAAGSANPLASSKAVANRQRWEGGGLQSYFDTRDRGASRVGFSVVLARPGPEATLVTTRAAAEAFFERPDARDDGRVEQPNLFRPYWQAKLSAAAGPRSGSEAYDD